MSLAVYLHDNKIIAPLRSLFSNFAFSIGEIGGEQAFIYFYRSPKVIPICRLGRVLLVVSFVTQGLGKGPPTG